MPMAMPAKKKKPCIVPTYVWCLSVPFSVVAALVVVAAQQRAEHQQGGLASYLVVAVVVGLPAALTVLAIRRYDFRLKPE